MIGVVPCPRIPDTPRRGYERSAEPMKESLRGAALAAGVPMAVYVATVSPSGHWLDAGTFVAQASDLGIAHPPGHPLAGLVHGLAMLLPFGPVAFRVALMSGLCGTVGALFFFRAARRTYGRVGLHAELATPLAIASTWWLAGSYGYWFQAVRPEVYALQGALVAIALERLVAYEAAYPPARSRFLVAGAFAFGLAAANHHLLALLLLPAAAAPTARWVRERGWRPMIAAAAAAAAGVATYLYLPLRTNAGPLLRLGHPNSATNFYWTVSAQAFQQNQGEGVPGTLGERYADVAVQLTDSLHPVVPVLTLVGFYVLIRLPSSRRIGAMWFLVAATFVSARAWLGFVRNNPDALGYLIPAMMAIVVGAGAFAAALLTFAQGRGSGSFKRGLQIAVGALALGACGQFVRNRTAGIPRRVRRRRRL